MRTPLRFAAVGIVALLLSVAAWSFGSRPLDDSDRRERIAAKSQVERDQLMRRFSEYNQFSAAERREIDRLHEAVEGDAGLAQTLSDYEAFVSRLDPLDQQELQAAENVETRLDIVRSMIEENGRLERPGRPSWLSGRFVEGPVLTPSRFDQAISMLIAELAPSEADRRRIEEAQRPEERHLAAIEFAVRKRGNDRSRPWLDPEATIAVLELLPEGRLRDWLTGDKMREDFRAASIPSLLVRSLLAEWQAIVPEIIPQRQIEEVIDRIPELDQSEWARHDPGRLQRAIMAELEKQEGPTGEFAKKFGRVVELRNEIDPFARDRRRSFGRPPFGGPDRGDDRRGRSDGRASFGGPPRGPEEFGPGDRDRRPDDRNRDSDR